MSVEQPDKPGEVAPPAELREMQRDEDQAGAPAVAGGRGDRMALLEPIEEPSRDLVIEVVMQPGQSYPAALVGAGLEAAPSDTIDALSATARRFGVLEASPVFQPDPLAPSRTLEAADDDHADRYIRLRFPADASPAAVRQALEDIPEVSAAVIVPDVLPPDTLSAAISDPLVGAADLSSNPQGVESQWYLHRTRALGAWPLSRGSQVVIADCDWGCRTSHAELRSGITKKYNAFDGGSVVDHGTAFGHGTSVMGLAGARANGAGMAGYAPEAELWVVQCNAGPGAQAFIDPWIEGLSYVRRTDSGGRRKVVILEVQTGKFGNYEQLPSAAKAVRDAIADGCVVCVAAGNGDVPADRTDLGAPFPATGSILVGATAYHPTEDRRAYFSNYASSVVVCAPGDLQHDVTCGPSGDAAFVNKFGGTSGATPKVAGVAALMLSVNPALTHAEVRQILIETGRPVLTEAEKPIGVFLDAEAAVNEAKRRAAGP